MITLNSTSDKARADILDAALKHVPFEGWSRKILAMAAKDAGLPDGAADLYFPGGPVELIRFWSETYDVATADNLAQLDMDDMRIREKVTQAVWTRLSMAEGHEVALKRAISRLTLPDAIGLGPKQLWASADMIWRAIGDKSTDVNYYSKRTILSGVIGTTQLSWVSDDSPDKSQARAFLEARIGNVMQFETAKFQLRKRLEPLPNPAELLGRLRYGSRRRRRR